MNQNSPACAEPSPPFRQIGDCRLYLGDCLDVLRAMPDASVDAIVTDPPAGISFMGKDWDHHKGGRSEWIAWMKEIAAECLRVIKPGGHALVWAIPRTSHWTAMAWEDGGFEIRDRVAHVFGSGFPKSLDVSKAIDKAAGAERQIVGRRTDRAATPKRDIRGGKLIGANANIDLSAITAPATEAARQWQGWGTALKPAMEDWWLCRKPLSGTVAENVLNHGVGALNIDGCRIPTDPTVDDPRLGGIGTWSSDKMAKNVYEGGYTGKRVGSSILGRWPANLIHDGSDEVVSLFPASKGQQGDVRGTEPSHTGEGACYGQYGRVPAAARGDSGSAARFFQACPDNDPEDAAIRLIYCAKASKADRDEGCEGVQETPRANGNKWTDQDYRVANGERSAGRESGPRRNHHPTVKPTTLMRYLCRLITPPRGLILDPFMGSGSTGKAAIMEGFRFAGIERDPEYFAIAEARIAAVTPGMPL